MFWIGLIVGLSIGATFGMILMAALCMGGKDDQKAGRNDNNQTTKVKNDRSNQIY